ncbi:glycosyltransferase family 4 protein [Halobacterium salinarum]|uniref:glycosyltransferase family 4 protein n=1 Tax=Halobacterium salinarum TaxID=2242 RepID=UPI00255480DA|nr:glycosyltransferase family 4 protein [Halobacterium salinarum]MDL0130995.1 glycosyltransferase family 4 protein [Halobacterium salinarum]
MRVLHLSTSDTNGGAARAAYRLHSGLRSKGVDSQMLVQNKDSDNEHVYGPEGVIGKIKSEIRRRFDELPLKRYPDRDPEIFSPAWTVERRAKQISKHDPDVVHLHWVSGGFIRPETIAQIDVPVVWTLHDMWPFTGGCHYSKSCTKYQTECGSCPHLGSERPNDLAKSVWQRKREAWDGSDIAVVSPSQWLADQARESSLLGEMRIEVIPNGLDIDLFRPQDRADGLQHFELENDKHYVLFGAAYETSRKGGGLLLKALEQLSHRSDIVALTFGNTDSQDQTFPASVRHLGWLSEEELRLVYSTADVTVTPSTQEAFGQTAAESMASGTPVVAFNATGPQDIIDHKETGYLATPSDPENLAKGIEWVITDQNRNKRLGRRAREVAEQRFSIERVTQQHQELYQDILA